MKKKYTEVSKKEWDKLVKEKEKTHKRTCAFQTWYYTEEYGIEGPQCKLVSTDKAVQFCRKEICPFWRR